MQWQCDPSIVDPFKRLDVFFRNLVAYLQAWGQRKVGNIKIQLAIANTIIFHLEQAQDRRNLSNGEASERTCI